MDQINHNLNLEKVSINIYPQNERASLSFIFNPPPKNKIVRLRVNLIHVGSNYNFYIEFRNNVTAESVRKKHNLSRSKKEYVSREK